MPRQIQIQNQSRALKQPLSVGYCESFFCRLRGLTFRRRLEPYEGLILVQGRESRLDAAIHMLTVFMDLAVVWINADRTVVDAVHAKAWHLAYIPKRPAKYVLEIHPNRITDFEIGDKVTFING
jgi:uncharacterized membrane protein (UPF0127 family)